MYIYIYMCMCACYPSPHQNKTSPTHIGKFVQVELWLKEGIIYIYYTYNMP